MTRNRIYAFWHALFAAGTVITGGAALGDILGGRTAGFIGMVLGSLQAGVGAFYMATSHPDIAPTPAVTTASTTTPTA